MLSRNIYLILTIVMHIGGIFARRRPAIRLTGGTRPSQGTVEVLRRGEWQTVCGNTWTYMEAATACRELGFSWYRALPALNAFYGSGEGYIAIKEIYCDRVERRLQDCDIQRYGSSCHHSIDAGVDCEPDDETFNDVDIRMVDHIYPNSGAIEMKYQNKWGAICGDDKLGNWWYTETEWACKKLGYSGKSLPLLKLFSRNGRKIWHSNLNCPNNMTSFGQCITRPWGNAQCDSDKIVGVMCDRGSPEPDLKVRLTEGPDNRTGLVEVYQYGLWFSLCKHEIGFKAANLLCNKLGYPYGGRYAWVRAGMYRGPDDGRFFGSAWTAGIHCDDSAVKFEDCIKGEWVIKSCSFDRAWVRCFNEPFPSKPRIIGNTTDLLDGEQLTMKCVSDIGNEKPRLDWMGPHYRDGYSTEAGSQVIISWQLTVQKYMNGKTCSCRGWAFSQWSMTTEQPISVIYGPEKVELIIQQSIKEGENVTATCLVTETNPKPHIFLYIGDYLYRPSTPATVSRDSFNGYTLSQAFHFTADMNLSTVGISCIAYNPISKRRKEATVKPNVLGSILRATIVQKTTPSGSKILVFNCFSPSLGNITAVWRKNSTLVSPLPYFVLSDYTVADSGTYLCVAENEAFREEVAVRLQVDCKLSVSLCLKLKYRCLFHLTLTPVSTCML